jgi:hypothetical protein
LFLSFFFSTNVSLVDRDKQKAFIEGVLAVAAVVVVVGSVSVLVVVAAEENDSYSPSFLQVAGIDYSHCCSSEVLSDTSLVLLMLLMMTRKVVVECLFEWLLFGLAFELRKREGTKLLEKFVLTKEVFVVVEEMGDK